MVALCQARRRLQWKDHHQLFLTHPMGDQLFPSSSLDESVGVSFFTRSLTILFVMTFVHVLILFCSGIPLRRRPHSPPIVCTAPPSFNDTERCSFSITSFSLPSRGDLGDGSTRCNRMLFAPRSIWPSAWVPSHVDEPAPFSSTAPDVFHIAPSSPCPMD